MIAGIRGVVVEVESRRHVLLPVDLELRMLAVQLAVQAFDVAVARRQLQAGARLEHVHGAHVDVGVEIDDARV